MTIVSRPQLPNSPRVASPPPVASTPPARPVDELELQEAQLNGEMANYLIGRVTEMFLSGPVLGAQKEVLLADINAARGDFDQLNFVDMNLNIIEVLSKRHEHAMSEIRKFQR
jgi:hypothetical protein